MHIAFVLNTVLLFNMNIHILLCSHKRLSACSGGHAAVCVEIVWREQLEPQSPPACRQTPRPHTNRLAELYSCPPTVCCDTAAQRTRCNSIMDPRPATHHFTIIYCTSLEPWVKIVQIRWTVMLTHPNTTCQDCWMYLFSPSILLLNSKHKLKWLVKWVTLHCSDYFNSPLHLIGL